MKKINALRTEALMRMFSDVTQLIQERRKEVEEENGIDKSKFEIVQIEVEMRRFARLNSIRK